MTTQPTAALVAELLDALETIAWLAANASNEDPDVPDNTLEWIVNHAQRGIAKATGA